MRLEGYWGVGPKTRDRLTENLGTEAAITAIENADVRALVEAGLSRGRATAILRRARGGGEMDILATRDARRVYTELVDLASEFALTRHAADRIRVLTPHTSRAAMDDRLDAVTEAMNTWTALETDTRTAIRSAFEDYDSLSGGDLAAVKLAIELLEIGVTEGVFSPLDSLDAEALESAADALAAFDGETVSEGADPALDRDRERLAAVERLEGNAFDVLDSIREEGVRGGDAFQSAVVQYLARETGIDVDTIRRAAPEDAADGADFVGTTLRSLTDDLRESVEEREATALADLRAAVGEARVDVDEAVETVEDLALHLSLARFADAYDCTSPTYVDDGTCLAVSGARNLSLAAEDVDVDPITYAVGDHGLAGPPTGDRVAVLTGANSGGKTTLLETCCQVAILAQMGLPVPAVEASVSVVDSIVFHRRHASFNAGVLESTLKSIVPPLASEGRTLMLVDEFEAITEPGSAADLLHGLVTLTVARSALGVFVTHLADDLRPLPDVARIDGIFAEGLDESLSLVVDYQPRFGELGRSTPEFIVSRLIANAGDRSERAGFETLATALGTGDVQRTLADADWAG